jgi:hypothetical protein
MISRAGKLILFVFFLSAAIDPRLGAWAEEITTVEVIDPKFAVLAEKTTTEEIIVCPRVEYKSGKLRDPFKTYFIDEEPEVAPEESAEEAQPEFDPGKFKVQGIIWGVKTPQAIINDKVLTIGDLIEEAKILRIEKKGITLSFYVKIFNLPAPEQNLVYPEAGKGAPVS